MSASEPSLEEAEPLTQQFPEESSLDGIELWRWRRELLGKFARFAGPAICIPLADPLLSLIDSVAVGQVRWLCMLKARPAPLAAVLHGTVTSDPCCPCRHQAQHNCRL